MKTLEVKILSDRTDTGGFGVEGYEIKLTSKRWSIKAFVNMKNIVTTNTDVYLHSLFDNPPYTVEFVEKVNFAVQKAFLDWSPSKKLVNVEI